MKKIFFIIAVSLLHILQIYFTFNHQLLNCILVGFSGMREIERNVYVSANTSFDETLRLKEIVKNAGERTRNFWNSEDADPIIILCTDENDYKDYGMYNVDGLSFLYTYGSYIVINKDYINENVLTHELCHAELFKKIGYVNDKKIPVWFHEGLAMNASGEIDTEFNGLLKIWNRRLDEKINLDDFQGYEGYYGKSRSQALYMLKSGLEVKKWLNAGNVLDKFIVEINNSKSFEEAFRLN